MKRRLVRVVKEIDSKSIGFSRAGSNPAVVEISFCRRGDFLFSLPPHVSRACHTVRWGGLFLLSLKITPPSGPAQHTTINTSSTLSPLVTESLSDASKRGKGFIVEGTISALRIHSLNSASPNVPSSKYLAIVVDTTALRKRAFDAQGMCARCTPLASLLSEPSPLRQGD